MMDLLDILLAQLTDPFRIGLLVALLLTTFSTIRATGTVVPLVLGAIFVAVLIPTAFASAEIAKAASIGVGLVSNAIILGILLLIRQAFVKSRSG